MTVSAGNDVPTPPPIYALRGVGKRYGAIFACRNISFDIRPGDIIGLAGENGAGKSTSMKCLAGWVTPTEGTMEVDGQRVAFASPRDAEKAGIAVIPQELDLFGELAVYENIFVGRQWPRLRNGLFDRRRMKAQASSWLQRLGADIDVNVPAKSMSPANQKLIEIARALSRGARLLIMDEPTAALTDMESQKLFEVIHELQKQGTAIIHITHRLDEIFQHCSRVIVLRDGEITARGPVSTFDTAKLINAMVGRTVDQFYTRQCRPSVGPVILEARGLSFPGAFQDVDLTLRAGEILGVAGLIGAGRTEIAHALSGIRPAQSGEIRLRGKSVKVASVGEAMRLGIAYLPEERRSQGLHLRFPIRWNMSFAALSKFTRAGFVNRISEREASDLAGKRFGVRAASLDLPVGSLSGGNQQKVLLAKILAGSPDVIILDEPTRGVDVGAKSEIYKLIEGLVESGKAVMLISSEIEEIIAMSDRVATVYHGRVNSIIHRDDFSAARIGFAVAGQVQYA